VILKSYAKVNLYLRVLNKRKDNFHNLNTVFERIDLYDKIVLRSRRDNAIRIFCKNPDVPADSSNLCFRAARSLQEKSKVNKGVDIKIIKNIPVGAGLGGGSGNAAAVLVGLNKLWKLDLSRKRLTQLGSQIGSDIAFFIYDTSFAKGFGRGEKIKPLPRLKKIRLWHILVVPKIHVSTPLIYRKWDESIGLTAPRDGVKILLPALYKHDLSRIGERLFNSLEAITIRFYPEVKKVKESLAESGLKTILMSGSGPAVFGITTSRKEAVLLCRKFAKEEPSWRVFATRTR
jgi:4-diphosphocytidyl-2-C-methyl-D-erythritol kinase